MQDDLESNADSVNYLITQLCSSIARQHCTGNSGAADVRRLKSQSFEILLKKSTHPNLYWAQSNDLDPQRGMKVHIFAAKLHANGDPEVCAKLDELEEQLESIGEEYYITEGPGRSVLQLLLELQTNLLDDEHVPTLRAPGLLVPGPFTLFANYESSRHYPKDQTIQLFNSKPRFFKGVHDRNVNNPYMRNCIFDNAYNKLSEIDKKYAPKETKPLPNAQDCTFTAMTRRLLGASLRIHLNSFRLFNESEAGFLPRIQPKLHLKLPKPLQKVDNPKVLSSGSTKTNEQFIYSWNWESFGCFGIRCEKPFTSEANVALDLQCYINQIAGRPFEAKMLTKEQFMSNLKLLTTGIQSDIFKHDEFIIFHMLENVTVEKLLPATIRMYVVDFLECGTCYKRLQTMIKKRDHKLMFDGFIYRALCSAIDEYLLTFRQFVYAQEDEHILGYYSRMHRMINQIRYLSYTLTIHPKVPPHITLPTGSQFLGYLYSEIVRITEKDFIMLLVYILKRCCHVYFKHLQKWIYHGLLDDPSNELFINFVDHYRLNTKYFYDKAYSVRKDAIPGFFQNYEDQILQCGKYTMLLKSCKPTHPLFSIKYPAISVNLTFDEIEKLTDRCIEYKEYAQKICGHPNVSIRQFFEAHNNKKRQCYQRACQCSRDNMNRWKTEQHERNLLVIEKKKQWLEEITTQMADEEKRKLAERRANVEHELRVLNEAKKQDDIRMLRENINLRKRIEYYQELNDMLCTDDSVKNVIVKKNESEVKSAIVTQVQKLSSENTTELPLTPASGDTEFESCEEDAASQYAECLSGDFIQCFEENEQELLALCNKNTEKIDDLAANCTYQTEQGIAETSSDAYMHTVQDLAGNSNLPVIKDSYKTFLKRSISDVMNSNEIADAIPVDSNTTITPLPETQSVIITNAPTEAQCNKMRVLGHTFGNLHLSSTMSDINLNTLPDNELTVLQRNRKRMMQSDTFAEFNKISIIDRSNLNLNLDTDRKRNKQRVLESEYNIITGGAMSSNSLAVDNTTTPMSTTSDISLAEGASTSAALANIELQKGDLENGNVLKINVEKAVEAQKDQLQSPASNTCVTVCALTEETPECALNTAGLQAKKGFDFVDIKKSKKQQEDAANEEPIQPDPVSEERGFPLVDYSQPYKRSHELIQSNFKCSTRTAYVRLNLTDTPHIVAARKTKETLKHLKLNNISVITLTEFLQKSVIIPMTTHLELVNNEVMNMFLEELNVLNHFRSLRYYFFLMDGEFGAIISDRIIGQLESGAAPSKVLNHQSLLSVLRTALRSSYTGREKNAENLSFVYGDIPKKFDLSSPDVLNVLSLIYQVKWPLNLILNPETLEKYGKIFQYLMKVRRISWVLERVCQLLKEALKINGNKLLKSPQYRHIQLIRHKFYHFIQALQNHITANALQASWKTFKDDLLEAKSIEDIYRKHTKYVKRILFLCMLNRHSAEFYNTIENIFKISLRFYNNLKSREFKQCSEDEHYTHSRYEKLSNDEVEFDKFIKYTIYLGNKIVRHGYQEEIGEFINLITFNQYYPASTSN